jgi:hypothetical protein
MRLIQKRTGNHARCAIVAEYATVAITTTQTSAPTDKVPLLSAPTARSLPTATPLNRRSQKRHFISQGWGRTMLPVRHGLSYLNASRNQLRNDNLNKGYQGGLYA